MKTNPAILKRFLASSVILILLSSCEDFVKIAPPRSDLVKTTVFSNDETANAAILGVYNQMITGSFASGKINSLSFLGSLSSDDLINDITYSSDVQQFNDNEITEANPINYPLWSEPYEYIYKANAIIEGLNESLSQTLKRQLEGEAKFIRAFSHFYLTNLFGDIPLVLTTDYRINTTIPRTPKDKIYEQIIKDLVEAQNLLPENFTFSNDERIRINKWAATALLARVYLFTGDWNNAEREASSIINNTAQYELLQDLNQVFLKNSKETIWQLASPLAGANADGSTFIISYYPQYNYLAANGHLSNSLLSAFEENDARKTNWIGSVTTNNAVTYNYALKYKEPFDSDPVKEYSMVLRLAEQYLIRAEARAQQEKITEAQDDLNSIRNRANLPNTIANDKQSLLNAINQERRVELFTEWGHRWLDLKRTNQADIILSESKQTWQSTDQLYPIPPAQHLNDPNIGQNPGY